MTRAREASAIFVVDAHTMKLKRRKQRVISFADSDGAQVSIYFDATTNLPTKTETLNDDQILGDIVNETIYSDWRAVEKIMLPFHYLDRVGGSRLEENNVSSI